MKKMNLGMRISSGFAAVILLTLVLGISSVFIMKNVSTELDYIDNLMVPQLMLSSDLSANFQTVAFHVRGFLLSGDWKQFEDAVKTINVAINELLPKFKKMLDENPQFSMRKTLYDDMLLSSATYRDLLAKTRESM